MLSHYFCYEAGWCREHGDGRGDNDPGVVGRRVGISAYPFHLEAAPLRMAALIVSSFLFLYLGSASKLGPVGSIIALVIAYVMTLLSNIPMGEVATRGCCMPG